MMCRVAVAAYMLSARLSFEVRLYYVYLIRSLKDGRFYAGYTKNLKTRLEQHNRGLVRSTKGRRPLELVYLEAFRARAEAMGRERRIKSLGRAEKVRLVRAFERRCKKKALLCEARRG